jgi:hypothetical protein
MKLNAVDSRLHLGFQNLLQPSFYCISGSVSDSQNCFCTAAYLVDTKNQITTIGVCHSANIFTEFLPGIFIAFGKDGLELKSLRFCPSLFA